MLYAHAPINNEAHSTYQVSEIGNEIINQFEPGDFINAINPPLQRENNHNQEQLISTEYDPTLLRSGYNNLEQIFPYYDQNNYIPQSTENSNDNYMYSSINNELAGEPPSDDPKLYSNRDINILYAMAFQNMESVQSLTANISEKQKYQEEMNNFFRKVIKEQQETNAKLTNMQKETNEKLTNMNEKLTDMLQKIGNRLEIQENWSKEAHEWFQKNK
jgi:predicted nuclease with TOPRIM domain